MVISKAGLQLRFRLPWREALSMSPSHQADPREDFTQLGAPLGGPCHVSVCEPQSLVQAQSRHRGEAK